MNKIIKEEKGITFVTLVVTIIVMTLLASIMTYTIATKGGVIKRTKEVKGNYTEQEKSADERVEKINNKWGNVINKTGIDDPLTVN